MSGQTATGAQPVRVDVVRGDPTDEELAALIAVVTEAYAHEEAAAVAADRPTRTAWQLSARGVRMPLQREFGWGGFAG